VNIDPFSRKHMTDQSPSAKSPRLDTPEAPRPETEPRTALPGAAPPKDDALAPNNPLENFLGGSPLNVFVRLLFVSLVVGALLMWLDLHPADILRGVKNFLDGLYAMGFDAVRMLAEYVVAGAAIVVPIWIILRLANLGGGR